jgi:hypothetical protein
MGSATQVTDIHFRIPAGKLTLALELWRASRATAPGLGPFTRRCTSIQEVFLAFLWEPQVSKSGDIVGVSFIGEKVGDEDALFRAVAPAVDAGSYIQVSSDEGENWRWVFDGTRCDIVTPLCWGALPRRKSGK